MNGEEPVSSAPVGEQPSVVSLGPPSGEEVVDAVGDAMGALNRNDEFNKITGSEAPTAEDNSLGLPDSLNLPDPEGAGVADTSTPIGDLVPNLTTTTAETSSLTTTTVPETTTTTTVPETTTTTVPESTVAPTTTTTSTVPSTTAPSTPSVPMPHTS